MAINDRIQGISSNVAIKAPVSVATTANITLSGEQAIDGVYVTIGDRVLVKDQTDASENGIYDVNTGEWQRAPDFDGTRDFVNGTRVYINGGATWADAEFIVSFTGTKPTIGTSDITFVESSGAKNFANLARDWATQTGGDVNSSGEHSAKEYAQGDLTSTGGSAKAWAQDAGAPDGASGKSAKTYADEAKAAKDTAEAAVAGTLWRDVKFLTNADSPYSVASYEGGYLFIVDTSGGAVTITAPEISVVGTPFSFGVKKDTSDANAITVNASGTDEIGSSGGTSETITSVGGVTFIGEESTTPDQWATAKFGATASQYNADSFSGDGSTTGFTLSNAPGSDNNAFVYIDGVKQETSTYGVSGTTLTFTTAPYNGASIEVIYGSALSVGTPADASVTLAKMSSSALASQSDAEAGTGDGLMSSERTKQAIDAQVPGVVDAQIGYPKVLVKIDQTQSGHPVISGYGVSSTVDNGTGLTRVNFNVTFASVDDAIPFLTCAQQNRVMSWDALTTTYIDVRTIQANQSTLRDNIFTLSIYGNLA